MTVTTQDEARSTHQTRTTDPTRWVDEHGDYLYRYAVVQVRDHAQAEDLVQETFLAALNARHEFAGRCSERTWLVGILKHKVADHFRRICRERRDDSGGLLPYEQEQLFNTDGEWPGHWKADKRPAEWKADPVILLEQEEFWRILQACLAELPPRIARVFWMREVEDQSTKEICKVMNISATNLWVMLHRARMQLRRSLELKWFGVK